MTFSLQDLTEIKGGLSNKKIYRKSDKELNKIIIDFSGNQKDFYDFLNIYQILKRINISIPKIYEVYMKKKLLVMEDFGDDTFDKLSNEDNNYYLLKIAVENLIIIQNSIISSDLVNLEKYSFASLKKEITEFVDFYLPHQKIQNFPVDEFYNCWEKIYKSYKFENKSFAHKDFEFINLIFLSKKNHHLKCGIIDFQSAFLGFIGWDLFSILENPRLYFSRKYNEELIKYFYENINTNIDFDSFKNQYYLLNLARQTRLIGRWAKLFNLEKNDLYLNYIKTTKQRIISCLYKINSKKLKLIYQSVLITNV